MNQEKYPLFSIITPVFGCSTTLVELYIRLKDTLSQISENFEIIFVNDASPDDAWKVIQELAAKDSRVKGICLSRNFGQHFAITAGLDYSIGDLVVVMDCDLQDKPEEIIKLYNKAQDGYDVVFGRRYDRKDKYLKILSSRLYMLLFDFLAGTKTDSTTANFSISRKIVVDNFKKLREHNRAFGLFIRWVGFNIGYIDIEHSERPEGKSTYTIGRLIRFGMDNIVAHSNKPLRISIIIGFLISFLSLVEALYLIYRYLTHGISVEGWTSVMVSIWFVAGLIFANMGLIGLYIGKIFDETKNRPLYIISSTINI